MSGLSKSRLMAGRQCLCKLWLYAHRPERAEVSAATETRFQSGFEVGEQARALYRQAVLAAGAPDNFSLILVRTADFPLISTPGA